MSTDSLVYQERTLSPFPSMSLLDASALFYNYCCLSAREEFVLQCREPGMELSVRFLAKHPLLRRDRVFVIEVDRLTYALENVSELAKIIDFFRDSHDCGGVQLEPTEAAAGIRQLLVDFPGAIEFRNGSLLLTRLPEDESTGDDAGQDVVQDGK